MKETLRHIRHSGIDWITISAFALIHFLPLGLFWTGLAAADIAALFVLYFTRGWFITAGYHRYFAHRGYSMGRFMQFIMALGGSCAIQGGVLWWAAHHRHHHRFSDQEEDIHSPIAGFFWAHIGWMLSKSNRDAPLELMKDMARYPELRWLNRWNFVPPLLLGLGLFALGGLSMLLAGLLSTAMIYHTTWAVNSITHLVGSRRYATTDTSKNSWWVALLTLGEGWHNNHHHYPATAKAGFRWYEIDFTYYVLKALNLLGLVWNLKVPSPQALEKRLLVPGHPDLGILSKQWRVAIAKLERLAARARHLGDVERLKVEQFIRSIKKRWEDAIRQSPTATALEGLIRSVQLRRAWLKRKIRLAYA